MLEVGKPTTQVTDYILIMQRDPSGMGVGGAKERKKVALRREEARAEKEKSAV